MRFRRLSPRRRFAWICRLVISLFRRCITFCKGCKLCSRWHWLSYRDGSLGPRYLSTLRMKGHVLHRARAHLKVPGWSLISNVPLTKKLPMSLSRLNESNGGCQKILPVSGWFELSNLKFFRMMATLLRGFEGGWNAIFVFSLWPL